MTISTSPAESTLWGVYLRTASSGAGYANRTLYINLKDYTIREKPVTQQMKDLFTGGRGFGLKLLWDAVTPRTKWDDPQNELIITNGPICGITAYPGTGKATVVTLSPLTGNVIDSNVGGYFSPFLKFSGFDALEIQGRRRRMSSSSSTAIQAGHDRTVLHRSGGFSPDRQPPHREIWRLMKKAGAASRCFPPGRPQSTSAMR